MDFFLRLAKYESNNWTPTKSRAKRSPAFPPMPEFQGSFKLEVVPREVVPTRLVVCNYQLLLLLLLPCASFIFSWLGFWVCSLQNCTRKGAAWAVWVSTQGCGEGVTAPLGVDANLREGDSAALAGSCPELKGDVNVRHELEMKMELMCVCVGGLLVCWLVVFFSPIQVEQLKHNE